MCRAFSRRSTVRPSLRDRQYEALCCVVRLRTTHDHPSRGRPEDRARTNIDRLLNPAGWIIQNRDSINIDAGRGIAIREFLLAPGFGFADYLLYVDGYAAGAVEAKKAGETLTEVEIQTARYSVGLPENLPALRRPLPSFTNPRALRRDSPICWSPTPAVGASSAFIGLKPSPPGWNRTSVPPAPVSAIAFA